MSNPRPNQPEPEIPVFTGSPDQRPSAEEWKVLWNVAPPDSDEEDLDEDPDLPPDSLPKEPVEYTYVYSQLPQPYEVDVDYADFVKEALQKEIPTYLESAKIPHVDEYGDSYFDDLSVGFHGEAAGYFDPIDRTIEITLRSPDIFTPGIIRHIQNSVLRKYPLWRIEIVATIRDGERSLTIYPDVLRVGDTLCPPADLDATIKAWQEDIHRIREPVEGPKRRQALYVRSLLPNVLPTVPRNGAALIAVFDNCRGNYQTMNAWIAYQKVNEDGKRSIYEDELDRPYSKDVNPVPPYRPGAMGRFYSDIKGNISGDVSSDFPFEISECLLPPNDEVTLTIRHQKSGSTHQFTIRRADAISDAELKRLLGEK